MEATKEDQRGRNTEATREDWRGRNMEATREDWRGRNAEATREGQFEEVEISLGKTRYSFHLDGKTKEAEIRRPREKTGEAEIRRLRKKTEEATK